MPARQFVSPGAREALANATIDENKLKLNSGQLERTLYEEVNEVLARLGGKWKGGKTAAHLFDAVDTAKLRDCLDIVLATGLMPPKNPNAFYFTPAPVQKRMFEHFKAMIKLKSGMCFLEPSAGKGHLYFGWHALFEEMGYTVNPDQNGPLPECWVRIEVVEIDEAFRKYLESKGVPIAYAHDFLSFLPEKRYDGILMNPPFDRENYPHLYIDHILYAYNVCLKPGAPLVGVTSVGFTLMGNQRIHKIAEFKELVEEVGTWEELPEKSFAEAGTSANTCIIAMQKPEIGGVADTSEGDNADDALRYSAPPPISETVVPEQVVVSGGEELQEPKTATTQRESSISLVAPSTALVREALSPVMSPLGTLSTFGLQVSGSEVQVAAFEELWRGIVGRKALFDLRTVPASKTKKAQGLPVAWQHGVLRCTYGMGYFHRTKFKHNARLVGPGGDQQRTVWEVSLLEGPIEELVNMLKWRYSLLLLDEGAVYEGSLRHAIVEALRAKLPDCVIGTLS